MFAALCVLFIHCDPVHAEACLVKTNKKALSDFITTSNSLLSDLGLRDFSSFFPTAQSQYTSSSEFIRRQLCPLGSKLDSNGDSFRLLRQSFERKTISLSFDQWLAEADSVFLSLAAKRNPALFQSLLSSIDKAEHDIATSDVDNKSALVDNMHGFKAEVSAAQRLIESNTLMIAAQETALASLFGIDK